jgi:ABC-type glycerol-3-phosphate transport system permease component
MTVMTGPALNGYSHKLHDVFFVLMLFKHWFPGILLVVSMYASK